MIHIDGEVVRVENSRLVCGKAVHRANQTVTIERADRDTTFVDRRHEHVDRNHFDLVAPDTRFERWQRSKFGGSTQLAELDRHRRRTSTDSVTDSRNGRSSVTPMPGPDGTGMMPSVASNACSVMSRAYVRLAEAVSPGYTKPGIVAT